MKWLELLLKLTPYIVLGVDKIHADLNGAGKQQAALDALGIATAGALDAGADPNLTQAASTITCIVIDKTVSDFNASGALQHKAAPTLPFPAPAPVATAPTAPVVAPVAVPAVEGVQPVSEQVAGVPA